MHNRALVTTELVQESGPKKEFVLLSPAPTPARTGKYFQQIYDYTMIPSIIRSFGKSEYLAFDFETKGNDISDPELEIVGLGLAWDRGSCYLDWASLSKYNQQLLIDAIIEHPATLAHNVYFDGGIIFSKYGRHPKGLQCTLAMYMMLANEGWPGQQHGLKAAQIDILQWESSNETELDEWLIAHGFYKGNRLADNSPENLLERAKDGSLPPSDPNHKRKLSPDKGEMWRAPIEVLGKYCILDADSCYLLFKEHLLPAIQQFPEFQEWFREKWMLHIQMHIEQKLLGIHVDTYGLESRRVSLAYTIEELEEKILKHPDIAPHIPTIEADLRYEIFQKEPERYKKQKVRPPAPPQFTKSGAVSKNWILWNENAHKYLPEQSKLWENWLQKCDKIAAGQVPEYNFNISSGPQLQKLFYQLMGMEVRVLTPKKEPGTGIKAMKHFGEVGSLFIDLAYAQKELSYITDYMERTQDRNTIHPSFRLPGTKTGRLSSKGPNLQQVPKSKAMMSLFHAAPGKCWVDLDFSALEPVVATEFSGDENMSLIYADGRPPNDIYLFVGAHIPGMGDKIRAAGYDPKNPTKEGIAAAKSQCKHERAICKTVTLACQYGAGVGKVMETLEQQDVFLSEDQVLEIHAGYWNLFKQVKGFGYDLQKEWKRNGGYVVNGRGRPMCLTEEYKHDVLNRFIQSTGHDILVDYCYVIKQVLDESGIPWAPKIWDWHDSVMVEVPEDAGEEVSKLFLVALARLNDKLGGTIKLKGTPTVGYNLADVKEPEE